MNLTRLKKAVHSNIPNVSFKQLEGLYLSSDKINACKKENLRE